MVGNIVTHTETLRATTPQLVTFETRDLEGRRRIAAVASGLIAQQFAGARYSINHSIEIEIALPFRPAEHAVSLSPRGFEIRHIPLLGLKRIGWSIVDYAGRPTDRGLVVNATVWVNHPRAVALGVIYQLTALSASLDEPPPGAPR